MFCVVDFLTYFEMETLRRCEKHVYVHLYKFIAERYLTSIWKCQYENISFSVPAQHEVHEVMIKITEIAEGPDTLNIHVASVPPHGRPT